jgi:hypothetical protein
MPSAEALKLASHASEIFIAKGSKVVHIDLSEEKPDEETLLGYLLGPTGNLRAPTFLLGDKLVVGFNKDIYLQVLAGKVGAKYE